MLTPKILRSAALVVSAVGVAVSSAACGSAPAADTASRADAGSTVAPPVTTPLPSAEITVHRDVRFAPAPQPNVWTDRLMDFYVPKQADSAGFVVLFTAHGTTKDEWTEYAELATALARRGLVVAVSNWSQLATDESTADKVLDVVAEARAVQSCAVSFAVGRAARFGADPQHLVIMGQWYGANLASMTALAPRVAPVSGCAAPPRPWRPEGLVVWDADWLAAMPTWDNYGPDAARIAAAVSPWSVLATAPHIPVVAAVSDNTAQETRRCESGASPKWLQQRDPTGRIREQLLGIDAFVDGCVDVSDSARAMVKGMQTKGIPASMLALHGSSTAEELLDPADLAALVSATAALAR